MPLENAGARPLLDGLLALNIDLALDAVAIRLGFWDWGQGFSFQYFGVPYANFWAWFWVVTSFSLGYRILALRTDWIGQYLSANRFDVQTPWSAVGQTTCAIPAVPTATPTMTPSPTPTNVPVPAGVCGAYNAASGTTPITWTWTLVQASGLQVFEGPVWWFNNWTTSPHTETGIPAGQTAYDIPTVPCQPHCLPSSSRLQYGPCPK